MKPMKIITVCVILLCAAASGFAQSVQDNPDYVAALELQKSAEEAYANGDYEAAHNFSAQAEALFNQIHSSSNSEALRAQADAMLKTVSERMAKLDVTRAKKEYPDKVAHAENRQDAAKDAFASADYRQSINESQAALDALDELERLLAASAPADEEIVLPRYYIVRLIPGNRDCLWNIAGYPFVYGDPFKWKILYDANKKKLVIPANPHLILPKQVFEIPSIAGEKREGTYDPAKKYPPLPKK